MERINTDAMTSSVGLVFQHKHLDFLQNNTAKQDINNVYSVYGSEYTGALVLWGCVPTFTNANNTLTITKGAVSYNGEVYEVLAGASTKTGGNVHLLSLPVITPDASDPSLLTNGTSINVQDIRRIEVSQGLTGTGSCDWVNVAVMPNYTIGTPITTIDNSVISTVNSNAGSVSYYKVGRVVTVQCNFSDLHSAFPSDNVLASDLLPLPLGRFNINLINDTTYTTYITMIINTNGTFKPMTGQVGNFTVSGSFSYISAT